MHLEGAYTVKASRKTVWNFVTNPEKIGHCLPDLQDLEIKDPKTFTATVKVGISFVRGSFKFDFTLLEELPPAHSKFEAKGKGAGVSVQLVATIDLKELEPNATELTWKADAILGGLLREISPSLIQSSTNEMTQGFFECVKKTLESAPPA